MEKQQQGQRKEYKKKTAHFHSTHLQLFFLIKYFPFYLHAFLQFSLCVAIISSFFAIYNISFFFFFSFFFFMDTDMGAGALIMHRHAQASKLNISKGKKNKYINIVKQLQTFQRKKRDSISFQLN